MCGVCYSYPLWKASSDAGNNVEQSFKLMERYAREVEGSLQDEELMNLLDAKEKNTIRPPTGSSDEERGQWQDTLFEFRELVVDIDYKRFDWELQSRLGRSRFDKATADDSRITQVEAEEKKRKEENPQFCVVRERG